MLMRFAFSVVGPVKFLSHLDLLKLFGKSVKRAGLPIAYSEGFNPHPRIAFGPPRGVAIAGLNEYCDMRLQAEISPKDFIEAMNRALPKGIEVRTARAIVDKVKPLQAVINLAEYEAILPERTVAELEPKLQDLLAATEVPYTRRNPRKGDKKIDLRGSIADLKVSPIDRGCLLSMSLLFGESGSVKPTEVVDYLIGEQNAVIQRTGLFILNEKGERLEP